MKAARFLLIVTSCLLSMGAISHADDEQRALADIGLRPGKSVNDRSVHISRSINLPILKSSPTTSRNQGLAAIGGPAKASRSTAMINGTNLKRKP
jgi:hypothetical protein